MKPRSLEELDALRADIKMAARQEALKRPLPDKFFNGLFREFFSKNNLHVRWICKDTDDTDNPGYTIDFCSASGNVLKKVEFKHGEESKAAEAYEHMIKEAEKYDTLTPPSRKPKK